MVATGYFAILVDRGYTQKYEKNGEIQGGILMAYFSATKR